MSKTATVKLKTEGVTQLTKELNSAATAADKLEDSLEGTAKAAEDTGAASDQMSGGLDRMSGGMITMFKGAISGAKTFVLGLRSVKGAMMATGIGALVVIVASLVMYFTKTKKGAELLEIASASLGVVMGKLTDTMSGLGESMIGLFTDPKQSIIDFAGTIKTYVLENIQKMIDGLGLLGSAISKTFSGDFSGAMEDATKGAVALGDGFLHLNPLTAVAAITMDNLVEVVTKVAKETKVAVAAQIELTKATQALRQAERDLMIDEAKKLALIAEQEVISKDITKTFEERLEANTIAQEAEASLHAQRVANANEALRIHQEEMGLTESLEEDYQRESELMAAAINLNTQSAKLKKKFTVEEKMLREQMAAEGKAKDDAELLRINTLKAATQSKEQNEIDAVALKYLTLNEMAMGNDEIELALKEKHDAELFAITAKYADKEEEVVEKAEKTKQELRKSTIDSIVGMTNAAFSVIAALDKGRDDDDKKTAKARFKRAKAMQMAAVVMSTGSAVIGALSAPPVGLGFPAGIPGSIAAAATGAASVISIAKTKFDGGATTPPPPPDASSANQTTALIPDTFAPSDTSATSVESLVDNPVKAYVVAQDMTSQQEMDANLLHHATL